MIFPLFLGVFGVAALCALGVWQVQRLHWKQEILAKIDSRIAAPPVQLPAEPREDRDNFLAVTAEGYVLGPELLMLLSRQGHGPGFRVIAVFETNGRRVLLDRGFIPERARRSERAGGWADVVGNLHWPDEMDAFFTPEPEGNLWFARDVGAMAKELGAEPVLIVARQTEPPQADLLPWPVNSSGIPNNHRNYAITWLLMAVAWCGMTALWVWRISRPRTG